MLLVPLAGFENVYGGVGEFAKWTQTGALLEVVHALVGEFVWILNLLDLYGLCSIDYIPTFNAIFSISCQRT